MNKALKQKIAGLLCANMRLHFLAGKFYAMMYKISQNRVLEML